MQQGVRNRRTKVRQHPDQGTVDYADGIAQRFLNAGGNAGLDPAFEPRSELLRLGGFAVEQAQLLDTEIR